MENTLFTELSIKEESNLSGGGRRGGSFFSNNNVAIGNTAVSIPISVGNLFSKQISVANAGNIYD
ncbi:MAG: hypothetical protein RMZ43_035380 [Nostoc sp. CmiVER01]|uniref:hypothetical protein n=1 Tax=Nostoc sp. CmiVER01 TaxID=3075384 RepID=UPI002AD407F9|nr:hypothetical protein [Nostoc sp. CmiVER01]MDZ8120855.1 hypothetical protein [Nostoc sp. CmiVER01]